MTRARTSHTHPLKIDAFNFANGRIGLTLAPGRCGPSVSGPDWQRDLQSDVAAIKAWGAAAVVSAVTSDEMTRIGIPDLGVVIRDQGMEWFHLPFPDATAPDADWWRLWEKASPRVHRLIEEGKSIVFHCRAGLERAPTMVALLMMERGIDYDDAVGRIAAVRRGAMPLPHQRRALIDRLPPLDLHGRQIRAMLRAGALGDAMGAEIEFWKLRDIRQRFPHGVNQLLPHDRKLGAITDDTQMVLFTAEGLIRAKLRYLARGICHPAGVVHHALLRWMATQSEEVYPEINRKGLIEDPRLHAARAPGLTCLAALRGVDRFGMPAANGSKGCGSIMRVAPVAFAMATDPWDLALQTSYLTHGHPDGAEAAAFFVSVLVDCADGVDLHASIGHALARTESPHLKSLIAAMLNLPRDGQPATVAQLGEGWVADEALAIALYAGLCARDLDHGLQIALVHSGDSDSTAAIAGNLLGILFEPEVLHHPLIEQVECADLIERIARDMRALDGLDEDEGLDRMLARHPAW